MRMNVVLPPDLKQFLQQLLDDKVFDSTDAAVAEALHLLKDQYALFLAKRAELERELKTGLEQADRGELLDGAEVFRQLRERQTPRAGAKV
jgi:antitoxin ParD1/3/4